MASTLNLQVYESDVNTSANTSVVTAVVSITTTGASWNGYSQSGTVWIDGAAYGFSHPFYQNTTTELARFSRTITHNSDGSRDVYVKVSFDTGISAGVLTKDTTLKLTNIPRASSISSINWEDIEKSFNVAFTSLSSSFRYQLRISIPGVQVIKKVWPYDSKQSVILTQAEKNTIYQYMVDKKLSSVSLGFVIETWTYDGTTKIGESSEPTKTITKPGLSSINTDKNIYNVGNTVVITIKKNNSIYTHKLLHKLNGINLETTTPTTSESYTGITLTEFGKKYPNNNSGTLELVLETYYNTILLGQTTKSLTFNLPNYTLTSPILNVEVVNDNAKVKEWGIYLQNYSKYKATISGEMGYYSSTISKYLFNGSEKDTSTFTSNVLSTNGKLNITGQVKDSRGKVSAVVPKEIDVVEYSLPSIENVVCQRYNGLAVDEEGTQLKVLANFNYASCAGKNTATCKVFIKENTVASWTELGVLVSGVAKVFSSVKLDIKKVYNIKIVLTDALNNKTEQPYTITTASAIIDVLKNGTGVAIGKMASVENLFDISWNTKIDGILTANKSVYIKDGIKTSLGGRDGYAIQFLAGNESCTHMVIGAGGATIIGGGDAAKTILDNAGMTGANSESMCIGNDANIRVYTNLQNGWSDAKQFVFNKNGNFEVPNQLKINEKYIKTGTSGGWELYEFGNGMKMSCLSLDFNIGGWEVWGSGYTTVNGIPNKPMPSSFFSSIKGGYIVTKSGIDYGHWWEHDGPWTPTQTPKFYMVRPNNPGVAASTVRVTIYVFGV